MTTLSIRKFQYSNENEIPFHTSNIHEPGTETTNNAMNMRSPNERISFSPSRDQGIKSQLINFQECFFYAIETRSEILNKNDHFIEKVTRSRANHFKRNAIDFQSNLQYVPVPGKDHTTSPNGFMYF